MRSQGGLRASDLGSPFPRAGLCSDVQSADGSLLHQASRIDSRWRTREIRRINWIITGWFRTAAYYASGGWRATLGRGRRGVLLNQSPHQLDLWQWLFGMPRKVRAFCEIGRYHDIEVEDDVTAYFEYRTERPASSSPPPEKLRARTGWKWRPRMVASSSRMVGFSLRKTRCRCRSSARPRPRDLANARTHDLEISFVTTGTARGNASGLCG